MKKNIIFIHLESLNQNIFAKRQWFPCLNKVYKHSLSLNNFISSATSSIMALSDLIHGDDNTMEHNQSLEIGVTVRRSQPPLFDQLATYGYKTLGVGYPNNWADINNVWSDKHKYRWCNNAKEMIDCAEDVVKANVPFALYFWNLSSHLCYIDSIKASGKHSFDRWQKGYQSMDATVGMIFQLLTKYKQLENTIVIGFGDHGDDFWNHGFNGGFAHGIEPYTSLVHTPAFIFNSGFQAKEINHMVSLVDLKKTSLQLLGIAEEVDHPSPGYFALSGTREFCYSRNLFANQKEQSPNNPLKKGYSITSDYFHLLKVDGRYKMFAWQTDSGNQFDLLSILDSKQDGSINLDAFSRGRKVGAHPHIKNFLPADSGKVIVDNFQIMKDNLEKWTLQKTQYIQTPI